LRRDAAELHEALTALVRLYQFRDRNGICCEDVSVTQCYTLNAIARLGSPTLGELAGEMYLDKSTTSRVVDSLARKGYARRVEDSADRRAVRIETTAEGRTLAGRIERRLVDGEEDLIADLDPEVRRATSKLIARLARAARERFEKQGLLCCGTALRPCRPGDLAAVRGLVEETELCTEGLEDQFGDAYVIAEAAGRMTGCAGLEIHGPYGLLRSVAVRRAFRGRGIAAALVADRLTRAAASGIDGVYLLAMGAAEYFEKMGFERIPRESAPGEIQRSVEFSQACPKDAIVMRLDLNEVSKTKKGDDGMDIKKQVREKYAEAARQAQRASATGGAKASCCGDGGTAARSCCGDSAAGPAREASAASAQDAITANLYDDAQLKDVPVDAALASLGCGNPTALAELKTGEVVLDLGSGGGIDVILSARRVGPSGKAYGLDMTDEMLEVARANQKKAGVENVEFLKGEIENVPLPDGSVDVVISNCVINLSPDKERVLKEAYRVLKPGGRLAVADIVSRGRIPDDVRRDMELWTGCIAGALEENEYRSLLRDAGFGGVEIEPTRTFRLEKGGCCGSSVAVETDPSAATADGVFMSAFIRAVKPR
jgi:N-acetylglutamate synthase-like GNAT family acetyltransferase/SAM-dependent methyltransferase/DNA-binding MarR family transcriptional regulator